MGAESASFRAIRHREFLDDLDHVNGRASDGDHGVPTFICAAQYGAGICSFSFEKRDRLGQAWKMPPKLRWIAWVIAGGMLITTAIRAFWVHWTWNWDQWVFVLLLAVVSISAGARGYIWLREGTDGLKARQVTAAALRAQPLSKMFFTWSALIWIAVALALVVLFNFLDRPHH